MKDYKQVIVIRTDIKMSKGKTAAQASHASVDCILKADREDVKAWRSQGMKKVVLKAGSKEELYKLKQDAQDAGLVTGLITDAGETELEPGTVTCLGIGPAPEEKIDKITGHLDLA